MYPALSRTVLFLFSAAVVVMSGFVIGVVAQETQPQKPVVTTKKTYGGRDPFRKYEPPRPAMKRDEQSAIPNIQDRINQYKAQKKIRSVTVSAMRASPQPYWRDSVSADLYYKPDIVKSNSYTVCWRGVVSRRH